MAMIFEKLMNWQSLLDICWLLVLCLLLRNFYKDFQLLKLTKSWLMTKGKVDTFDLIQQGSTYWPKISYSYQVNDQEFKGNYLFLDTSLNTPYSGYSRRLAYKVANAFKEGKEVDVFYDPSSPDLAVLDTSIPRKLYAILIGLSGLIGLHIILIVYRIFW